MFEVILINKKSKYREKPVMNIDADDPCSWEELKDKPVIQEHISYVKSSSIPTSGWETKTGCYEINIAVSGLDVTSASVLIDVDTSDVISADELTDINDSWNKILKIFATTNNLYVVATEIPNVAIPLKIKVDRYTTL